MTNHIALPRPIAPIIPDPAFVLIVEFRARQVLIKACASAEAEIHALTFSRAILLREQSVETKYAAAIAAELQARFDADRIFSESPLFAAPYAVVIEALGEYDCNTGKRMRAGPLTVGLQVTVTSLGGVYEIEGFAQQGIHTRARILPMNPGTVPGVKALLAPLGFLTPLVKSQAVA